MPQFRGYDVIWMDPEVGRSGAYFTREESALAYAGEIAQANRIAVHVWRLHPYGMNRVTTIEPVELDEKEIV